MAWAHHLQNDVARNFEKSVRDKEQRNGSVVLHTAHLQLLGHTSDFSIADCSILAVDVLRRVVGMHTVTAIYEGDEVEERKHRDESHVHFPQYACCLSFLKLNVLRLDLA